MKGRVAEIFSSVQGEGIYLGERQVFVRFFGCNLKCRFCDTPLNHFREYEPQELFAEIKNNFDNQHSVSFTGGEPLLQKDFLKEILRLTSAGGLKNYLETNGTLAEGLEEVIEYVDIVAMDLKLPTSTGMDNFWDSHSRFLEVAFEKEVFLKAIICRSTEEKDLLEGINLLKKFNRAVILVLQPDSSEDYGAMAEKLENFKNICINNNISACIIPQVHKITGLK